MQSETRLVPLATRVRIRACPWPGLPPRRGGRGAGETPAGHTRGHRVPGETVAHHTSLPPTPSSRGDPGPRGGRPMPPPPPNAPPPGGPPPAEFTPPFRLTRYGHPQAAEGDAVYTSLGSVDPDRAERCRVRPTGGCRLSTRIPKGNVRLSPPSWALKTLARREGGQLNWVPSHVGGRGNEGAGVAVKRPPGPPRTITCLPLTAAQGAGRRAQHLRSPHKPRAGGQRGGAWDPQPPTTTHWTPSAKPPGQWGTTAACASGYCTREELQEGFGGKCAPCEMPPRRPLGHYLLSCPPTPPLGPGPGPPRPACGGGLFMGVRRAALMVRHPQRDVTLGVLQQRPPRSHHPPRPGDHDAGDSPSPRLHATLPTYGDLTQPAQVTTSQNSLICGEGKGSREEK
ncbi:hypothetical protein GWK47_006017 [Chionoecetes opilio]|uniref:Uncharacterized protein n=1 Tax=Chionoecetes opilio TaxID=41210 RepID=A0A8J4Y6M3_CHIOP|nr:hypothetical protein GWK47_006017 [Chionoecetes opilio]